MKKLILFSATIFTTNLSFAQLTDVKDTVFATMTVNSSKTIEDKFFNLGTTDIPVTWNLSTDTYIAPGHSGSSLCFYPGDCYIFNNTVHSSIVPASSAATLLLSWDVSATAAIGSTSYVILNTNINGGKKLVRKITVVGALSTEELEIQSIKIYPIPSTNVLYVETPITKTSKIEIINIQGALVNTTPTYGNSKTEISLGNLSAGLYFANIYNAENKIIARKKITKN